MSGPTSERSAVDRRIDELLQKLPPLTDEDRRTAAAVLAAAPRPKPANDRAA